MSDAIAKLREIRKSETLSLPGSPFLKPSFENGDPIILRNYQKSGIANMLLAPRTILGDGTGLGKAQPIYSKVLTPSGWVEIGTIKPGDLVIGCDGLPHSVKAVYPQGIKNIYKVTMSDGFSTECCDEHLWTVRTARTKTATDDGWRTYNLKYFIERGLKRQKSGNGLKYFIPLAKPIRFPKSDLPIDPYLLGSLLGDGCIIGRISITNGDPDLFNILEPTLPSDVSFSGFTSDGITKRIKGKAGVRNSLSISLSRLGLLGTNWTNKFIPSVYLLSSIDQRTRLLQGLMDTDGYVSKDGMVTQFYSSNKTLVDGFVQLVQSLGGIAKVKPKTPILGIKSKAKRGRLSYIVTISLPNDIQPFRLPRKVKRWRPKTKYLPSRRIAKIEESGSAECVCISVDASDHLYVTDNFIVTHNTLQTLSTVGYVWLKEPDYIPIILTTKSALFQWASETTKFMSGMTPVTVHGEPYERHNIYDSFFSNHKDKQILLLTYDTLFRDIESTVVRDRSIKPDPALKKQLKALKDSETTLKDRVESLLVSLKEISDARRFEDSEYIFAVLNSKPGNRPTDWTKDDDELLATAVKARQELASVQKNIHTLNDQIAPAVRTIGILEHIQSMKAADPNTKFMLVMDEAHKVKNYRSQVHEKVRAVSLECERIIGMTATPVKNRLMEFFGLFRIVEPKLFPKVTAFQNEYCVTKLQRVGGGRQVPIVVGYKNLDRFVEKIEPYYLSRKKHEVAKELPELISIEIPCELSQVQDDLYDMAEAGVGSSDMENDGENGAEILSSLTMCAQAVNAPQLILDDEGKPFDGSSSKIDALLDLLENDAADEKVIIFSRFEKMISLLEARLKEAGIKNVRITGKESNPKVRQTNRELFQDPNSGVNVIMITMAGSESLNLQAAEHFVFVDLPWSFGDYDQLIGRMIRIGSAHKTVVAHHMLGVRLSGEKTIDHHVLKALREKKKLADKVAGNSLVGGLKFEEKDSVRDILSYMRGDDKKKAVKKQTKVLKSSKQSKIDNPEPEVNREDDISTVNLDFSDI